MGVGTATRLSRLSPIVRWFIAEFQLDYFVVVVAPNDRYESLSTLFRTQRRQVTDSLRAKRPSVPLLLPVKSQPA